MSGTQAHHAGGTRARIGRAATGVVSSAAQFGSDRTDIAVAPVTATSRLLMGWERSALPELADSAVKSIHGIVGVTPNPPGYVACRRNGKRPVELVIAPCMPSQYVPSDLSTPDAVRE